MLNSLIILLLAKGKHGTLQISCMSMEINMTNTTTNIFRVIYPQSALNKLTSLSCPTLFTVVLLSRGLATNIAKL